MNSFKIKIYSAERVFYEGPCESLIVPTTQGMFGVMANHANMIAALIAGELMYRIPGGEDSYAVISDGVIKIEDGAVLVLVDVIERPEEIDENRAKREAEEAREILLQKRSRIEYYAAQAQLGLAINKLRVKKRTPLNLP